jgi:hypothetical protein
MDEGLVAGRSARGVHKDGGGGRLVAAHPMCRLLVLWC